MSGFRECILRGSLKHYFIPGFNLFSIKLTTEARSEILRSFDGILQSDISIMKNCNTLKIIWDQFVNYTDASIGHDPVLRRHGNQLKTDACLIGNIATLQQIILKIGI